MHIDDRVIFVHNPRAAGTSVRRALAFGKDPNTDFPGPARFDGPSWNNEKHAFATTIKSRVNHVEWAKRFRFGIVRHPLDRLVSIYHLFRRPTEAERMEYVGRDGAWPFKINKLVSHVKHSSINVNSSKRKKKQFIERQFALDFSTWLIFWCEEYKWNLCRYLDDDRPMTRIGQWEWMEDVNRVYRFEALEDLFYDLERWGYPRPIKENATNHDHWSTYYRDPQTWSFAERICEEDLKRYGY